MAVKNTKVNIVLFDDEGTRYEIFNIEAVCNELLDEDLEIFYKSTRYFHELELAKLELIELGLMTQEKGEEYVPEYALNGVTKLGAEIVKRSGAERLSLFDSEVDLSWQQNKPDLEKYREKAKDKNK